MCASLLAASQMATYQLNPVCENPYKFPYQNENILNRPITNFFNGDDINVIAAGLRLTKTRPISFCKKYNHL